MIKTTTNNNNNNNNNIIQEPVRFLLYAVQSGMQLPPLQGEVGSALPLLCPYPESRPMSCMTPHIRGVPSTVHNGLCNHPRHKSNGDLDKSYSDYDHIDHGGIHTAPWSPNESRIAQGSTRKPRRAQTSPKDHRIAQENPGYPTQAQQSTGASRRGQTSQKIVQETPMQTQAGPE